MAGRVIVLTQGTREHRITVDGDTVTVDGSPVPAFTQSSDGVVRFDATGLRVWTAATADARWVFIDGEVFTFDMASGRGRRKSSAHHGSLAAPMPATVVRVQAAVGDMVTRGDVLVILEAMKMELPVRAPSDGKVTAVHCRPGELVQPGVSLIEIEAPAAED